MGSYLYWLIRPPVTCTTN